MARMNKLSINLRNCKRLGETNVYYPKRRILSGKNIDDTKAFAERATRYIGVSSVHTGEV